MLQEPFINGISVLILIGTVQGLFLALALVFMRRGNRRANLFLAALLFTLSILMIDRFMDVTNYYSRSSYLIGVVMPLNYLIGPFLYFYVRELSSPKRVDFSGRQYLHFLPAIVCALLLIPFYGMSANDKISMAGSMSRMEVTPAFNLNAALFLVPFQKLVYYILSFLLVMAYGLRIRQSFSSLDKISLSWLRTLLLLFFSLCFLFTFFLFFAARLGVRHETSYLLYLGMSVVTCVMAFKGLLRPEIFSRIEAAHQAELLRTDRGMVPDTTPPAHRMPPEAEGMLFKEKYQKSWLTDEHAAEIARQLLLFMETNRPYLEPELTLPELAEMLSVSPNDLSQVINREMNKRFFDFVNEYRVQEAKRLLSSPKHSHLSILGIALDAGFNSKSAFYTAFSKYIGTTPSGFRKQYALTEHVEAANIQGRA